MRHDTATILFVISFDQRDVLEDFGDTQISLIAGRCSNLRFDCSYLRLSTFWDEMKTFFWQPASHVIVMSQRRLSFSISARRHFADKKHEGGVGEGAKKRDQPGCPWAWPHRRLAI